MNVVLTLDEVAADAQEPPLAARMATRQSARCL